MTDFFAERIFYTNNVGEELSRVEKSAFILENDNDPVTASLFLETLIPVYTFLGLKNNAIECFNKIKKFAIDMPSVFIDSVMLNSKITLFREGLLQLSIEDSIFFALSLLNETKGDFKGRVYHALIILWLLRGDIEVAERLYDESLKNEGQTESIISLLAKDKALISVMKGEQKRAVEIYKGLLKNRNEGIYSTQILMELYRITKNEDYHTLARNNILYIMRSLPGPMKRIFVNRSQIKRFLLKDMSNL